MAVVGRRGGVWLQRVLGGLAALRAHLNLHLRRASVIASAAASSAASVFVHSLPTVRALAGSDIPLRGCLGLKGVHHSTHRGLTENGSQARSATLLGPIRSYRPQDGYTGRVPS